MIEFMRLGDEFFIPFFQHLWEFLGTEIFFGLTFKHLFIGGFLIRLSLMIMTLIFGLGGRGVAEKAVREHRYRQRRFTNNE